VVLQAVDDSKRQKMMVREGHDTTPVRRPVETLDTRFHGIQPAFMTPDMRQNSLKVNTDHRPIAQLQRAIRKRDLKIDQQEVLKG
jgi:hypothetical protein